MTDSQQQFCLRWNNFQANITSQFEALRDDEDFVDVTFACDGRRLQAHKVVLSACSPYFKELFKTNPCKHPIIFMRDVEFEHLQSLLEFMYAGEVNISQAELSTFLRTAESLQIRGLTDSPNSQQNYEKSRTNNTHTSNGQGLVSPSLDDERSRTPTSSPPPLKRPCRKDAPKNSSPVPAVAACATSNPRSRPLMEPQVQLDCYKDLDVVEPKVELPEYGSDEDYSPKQEVNAVPGGFLTVDGGMEVLQTFPTVYHGSAIEGGMPGPSHGNAEPNQEQDTKTLESAEILEVIDAPVFSPIADEKKTIKDIVDQFNDELAENSSLPTTCEEKSDTRDSITPAQNENKSEKPKLSISSTIHQLCANCRMCICRDIRDFVTPEVMTFQTMLLSSLTNMNCTAENNMMIEIFPGSEYKMKYIDLTALCSKAKTDPAHYIREFMLHFLDEDTLYEAKTAEKLFKEYSSLRTAILGYIEMKLHKTINLTTFHRIVNRKLRQIKDKRELSEEQKEEIKEKKRRAAEMSRKSKKLKNNPLIDDSDLPEGQGNQ